VIQPRTAGNIRRDSVMFNVDLVREALSSLKPSTYSGPDRIPNLLLKRCAYTQFVILSATSLIPASNLIVFLLSMAISLCHTLCLNKGHSYRCGTR